MVQPWTSHRELAEDGAYQERPQFKRAQNHADLLLRKDEIFEQSQLGWSLRTIWNTLKDAGEISCAYSTFLNHIHRLQKSAKAALQLREEL